MEQKNIVIRQETAQDYEAVYQLIREAFAHAQHRDGNEQDLVAALRRSEAFVPELSLVAQIEGRLVGHILFTKAKVGEEPVLALAPLSVLPAFWRQGIGTALIQAGHSIARQMGFSYSIVLGSETYYPRCGYLPAKQFGIEAPQGVPEKNLMAVRLSGHAKPVQGTVAYAKEFGI